MRLICPNCDAQYEVPDAVVPFEGRDVQCSDCGQTWFQHHPDNPPAEEEPAVEVVEEQAPPQRPKSRVVDSNVKDILQEEAQFEHAARARDTSNLESQPELGLDEKNETRARISRLRGEQNPAEAAAVAAAAGSRRDLFPDIDEINSTLRSTTDRRRTVATWMRDVDETTLEQSSGGFWSGFFVVVAIVALLFGVYVYAQMIAQAVPALDPFLNSYVTAIDNGRVWLNGRLLGMINWLEQIADAQGQN